MYNHIGLGKIKSFSFLDDLRSERGGKETLNSGSEFVFNSGEAVKLIYISNGSGVIKFNKKEFVVRTNDIFFTFPEYRYTISSQSDKKTEFYWCSMVGSNVNIFLDYININVFSPILRGVNNTNIAREMRILKSAYTDLSLADYMNYKGCLYKICAMLINDFSVSEWRKISHTSKEILYSGIWKPWPSENNVDKGEYYSCQENSFAELAFYGTGIKWYGVMNFDCGMADIIIDQNYVVTVDTYSPERITGQILYSDNTLPEGNHVIKILCSGASNKLSKGKDIVIEGFQVRSSENSCIIEEKTLSTSFKKVIEYMNNNYMKNESVSDIADKIKMSRCFFTTEFKKQTGYSPKQYINNIRIKKAKELLRCTDYTIMEISDLCGFNDVSYFMKCFKKYENMTVSQYRKVNKV